MQSAPVVLFSFVFTITTLLAVASAAFKAGRWFEHNKIWSVRRAEDLILLLLGHGEHYPAELLEHASAGAAVPTSSYRLAIRNLIGRKLVEEGSSKDGTRCVKLVNGLQSPYARTPRPLPEWARKKIEADYARAA